MFACLAGAASAQIPNGGFENWITPPGASYQDPVGWITFNAITTLEGGQPSCAQGTPGAVGSSYATVTTQGTAFGPIQGIISVGDNNGNTGFAYTNRPAAFTGQYQYGIQSGDQGMITAVLTKWVASDDSSHTVGAAVVQITGTQSGWALIAPILSAVCSMPVWMIRKRPSLASKVILLCNAQVIRRAEKLV